MQKKVLGFILAGILIILGIFSFFFFAKDESKVAEIVNEINENDTNYNNSQNNLLEKVINNSPKTFNEEAGATLNSSGNDLSNEIIKVKSGNFIKIDPLHYASGEVYIEKVGDNYRLVLNNDFASAPGPDLFVYLSSPQKFRNIALGGLDTAKTINLGVLKSQKGRQEYYISKNDFENYNGAVVIWCKQFGVQFSRADLE